ncbi:MAG: hypothetical protein IT576_13070, partial [Verrucomicrobiales bacterium]|nr:hypothetical protein [Verrucomicrobiales bacterium]
FPGQPWIQVGPFVDALLDEWHQNEFNRDALDSFGPDGKTGWSEFATLGTSFNIRYRVIKDGGANSFNVFNNGVLGPFFLPINNGMSLELQIDETLNQTTEPGLEEELKESGNNSPAAGGSAAPAAEGEAPAPAAGAPLDPFGAGAAPEAPGPMPAAGAAPDPFGAPAPPAGAAPTLPVEADPFKS